MNDLTIQSVFVPKSLSRNALKKELSINWKCTLYKAGKEIISHDYWQGIAHHPSYRLPMTAQLRNRLALSVESGRYNSEFDRYSGGLRLKPPSLKDFLSALLIDSDVINYPNFKTWAQEFGYDSDSIKARTIYDKCLETALTLRYYLGENFLKDYRDDEINSDTG